MGKNSYSYLHREYYLHIYLIIVLPVIFVEEALGVVVSSCSYITEPKRITGTTATQIDIIYAKLPASYAISQVFTVTQTYVRSFKSNFIDQIL